MSGSITLLALAPLTNVAVALMLDASFGHKLKNCVMMGGNCAGMFESRPAAISFFILQSFTEYWFLFVSIHRTAVEFYVTPQDSMTMR